MLKQNRSSLIILLVLLCGPFGQLVARGNDSFAQAQALMQAFFTSSGSPGLAVSVGLGGKIVWSEGFGYADLEQMVAVNPAQTLFRTGSTIKPMTAHAVARLVDAGRLDLDAPIQTWVPDFPQKRAPVTTRQLLAHLSGIRHYGKGEFMSHDHYETVNAGLVIFQNDPLVNLPGDAYLYSSYGYNLISAVIEGVSGQDYLTYMNANVFRPLGMDHTVPDYLDRIIPGRGRYYYRKQDNVLNTPEVDNSYKWASGGYIGTSDDLVRFGLAQLTTDSINKVTRDLFWTEQTTNAGKKTGYGLGWRIKVDENGHQWIGHGGGSVGGTTQLWIRPDDGLVIAMISNMSQFDFGTVLISLGEVFIPE